MRLGLTDSCYQYLFGGEGEMFVDRTSGVFDWRGLPRPYFLGTSPLVETSNIALWQAKRSEELGVPVVHASIDDWSADGLAQLRDELDANGQELMPAICTDLIVRGDELKQEIERSVEEIERYGEFGVRMAKFCLAPMVYNRFRSDPPLREQLDRLIDGLPPLVKAAEQSGITLAFENHLDYRASEVVEVIEAVDSPNLRFLFDTGNPFSVCEDPLDAVEVAAPYTVLVHIKDVVVLPWTPAAGSFFACMYACPLGEGNVDIRRIVEILAERAPFPDELTLAIETTPAPASADEDLWVEKGIEWMRRELAVHLNPPGNSES